MKIRVRVEDVCPRIEKESVRAYTAFLDYCISSFSTLDGLYEHYQSWSSDIKPPSNSRKTLETWCSRHFWNDRREKYRYEIAKTREDDLYEEVDHIRDKWLKAMHLSIDKATEMMQFPIVEKEVIKTINIDGKEYEQTIILKPVKWNSTTAPAYVNASISLANSIIGDITMAIETCKKFGYEVISKEDLEELKSRANGSN